FFGTEKPFLKTTALGSAQPARRIVIEQLVFTCEHLLKTFVVAEKLLFDLQPLLLRSLSEQIPLDQLPVVVECFHAIWISVNAIRPKVFHHSLNSLTNPSTKPST